MIITTFAGIINSVLSNPIWFVNTRMSISKEKKGIIQTVKDIYQTEGFTAFYKGVFPNLILVLNPIINFVIYEKLKKEFLLRNYSLNFAQLFLISSISKAIATIFTYPILTIKVQMHASKGERSDNMILYMIKMIKELGVQGLFRGFYAKIIQTVLNNGFVMMTFEKLKLLIKFMIFTYLKKRHIIPETQMMS